MKNSASAPTGYKRITSIDSLRAFSLFGILLVHAVNGFGSVLEQSFSSGLDILLLWSIKILFQGKCALIFNILFGISFYIILRKPNYPRSKFVWRCFLLMLIGLGTQFFYNSDALMWYGICGLFLVSITKWSNKHICVLIILLHIISYIICTFHLGDIILGDYIQVNRYGKNIAIQDFISLYPNGILRYFFGVLNQGVFFTFANFCIGYLIGRTGLVDKWDVLFKKKHIYYSFIIFVVINVLFFLFFLQENSYSSALTHILSSPICGFSGAVFYTIFFVYIYNHIHSQKILHLMEAYGRCGLTNYSLQGIIGVTVFFIFGLSTEGIHFSLIIIGVLSFYLLQLFFSNIWLRVFKNGPLEYIWRCATERKILPLYINNQVYGVNKVCTNNNPDSK